MKCILIKKSLLSASAILVALTFSTVSARTQAQSGNKPIQSATRTTGKKEAPASLPAPPALGRGAGTSALPLRVAAATIPAQQPVAFTTNFFLLDGESDCPHNCATIYTVPQGQRLVIQQLAATVVNTNSTQHSSAYVVTDGSFVPFSASVLPIILTEQADYAQGGASSFGGSQQVTIYLNAGETVEFGGARTNKSGDSLFRFVLYGYLVPAP